MKLLSASDLDNLCSTNQKVWIQNTTSALILLDMLNQSYCRIPPTLEPLCLNNYYSVDSIKQSANLRKLISDGVIHLFNPRDPKLKGKKGTIPKNEDATNKRDEDVDAHPGHRLVRGSMKLSIRQMKDMANDFAAIANKEVEIKTFPGMLPIPKNSMLPLSAYEEWYGQAIDTLGWDVRMEEVAEVAASLIYNELQDLDEVG